MSGLCIEIVHGFLEETTKNLEFWGGGPQNGTVCACGIKKTCNNSALLCNCDVEDGNWHTDEGYVTLKDALPLTGIRKCWRSYKISHWTFEM